MGMDKREGEKQRKKKTLQRKQVKHCDKKQTLRQEQHHASVKK